MDPIGIARWQFGITTVYHFLFVPLTIGLSLLVAVLQTCWVRTGDERWLKLTKFYGKLFLINFAMGVVTGLVQEFQFGMNWSDYSRFVGDIFGAPLALEGLLAFFLESTFLGLWIFGWDRLPKRAHLASIWLAAIGTVVSAYFILVANSFMQWPLGYRIDPVTHRARLVDFGAVLTNKVAIITFAHTIVASIFTGAALILGVALWNLMRRDASDADNAQTTATGTDAAAFRSAAKLGAWVALGSALAVFVTGDIQGKIMTSTQPMKMAAAEALYHTAQPAPFSILTIGTLDGSHPVYTLELPRLLSFLATGTFTGRVQGIDNLQAAYIARYGPGSYTPNIPITYWGFRGMIGFGILAALIAILALWTLRRGRIPTSRWVLGAAIALPLLPLAANSAGWIFTEMGRQPWIVFGALKTSSGVSPGVSTGEVITSLVVFTVLYGILAVVEVGLLLKYARGGLPDVSPPPTSDTESGGDQPLAFAY
jgi:cytochrome bd ubiquinol oxidase subunit I